MRVALVCAVGLVFASGCARRRDVSGTGDDRFDDSKRGGPAPTVSRELCGADGPLLLLDAATAAPLACTLVTVTQEPVGCNPEQPDCRSDEVFRGYTNVRGRAAVVVSFEAMRVGAVAEGYRLSYRDAAPMQDTTAELEMLPSEGFTLKVVDAEGNYLSRLPVTFKQGGQAFAQMKTNDLANLFFQRRPFSGEPVVVEAEGWAPLTVAGAQDLGSDGRTVTLRK